MGQSQLVHCAGAGDVEHVPVHDAVVSRTSAKGHDDLIEFKSLCQIGGGDHHAFAENGAAGVERARGPSYTHVYVPQLDTLCHHCGVRDPRVRELLIELDGQMARLHEALEGRTRILISADHGHVNVGPGKVLLLEEHDPLLDDLLCPPTGDGSVPLFHVKPGRHEHFTREFRSRYGASFALLALDEVEELRLLGPEPLSPLARRRFGDYMGIAPDPTTLHYQCSEKHPSLPGIHSGLRSGEMRIPLIVA